MVIPRDEFTRILVYHRQHGKNFVLYVLGIVTSKALNEELISNFYTDHEIMLIEKSSIMRFLQMCGFKLKRKYRGNRDSDVFAFEKQMNT